MTGAVTWADAASAIGTCVGAVVTALLTLLVFRVTRRDSAEAQARDYRVQAREKSLEVCNRLSEGLRGFTSIPDEQDRLVSVLVEFTSNIYFIHGLTAGEQKEFRDVFHRVLELMHWLTNVESESPAIMQQYQDWIHKIDVGMNSARMAMFNAGIEELSQPAPRGGLVARLSRLRKHTR